MFNRGTLFVLVLGAAIVVPYVLFDDGLSKTAKTEWNHYFGGGAPTESISGDVAAWFSSSPQVAPTELEPAAATVSIEEALRLDISPVWVTSRWPRVSTVLGNPNEMGMRVVLVTGTQPTDVAGSLTYYFDQRHQLQRITLTGLTGDESRIITHLMNTFGLRPQPTIAAGLYQAPAGPGKVSQAQVNHLPIVRNAAKNARVELAIELFRPEPVPPPTPSAAAEPLRIRNPNTPGPRVW
jgi:hypothetical protein